jgi:hypothetical protein
MGRDLSVAAPVTEQYVNFTAAEAIQAGDPCALGFNDGKAYFLNDPAAMDATVNSVRNFKLANQATWSQFRPAQTSAIVSFGSASFVKHWKLSNGGSVCVWGSVLPNANVLPNAAGGSTCGALYLAIFDAAGAQVGGTVQVDNAWLPGSVSATSSNTYFGASYTNVVGRVQEGSFILAWTRYESPSATSQLRYAVYSNAGTTVLAPTLVTTVSGGSAPSAMLVCPKIALLPNGNIVFAWGTYQGQIYGGAGPSNSFCSYHLNYAIFTQAGVQSLGVTAVANSTGAYGGTSMAGAAPLTKHWNFSVIPFSNTSILFAYAYLDYGVTNDGSIRRIVRHVIYNNTGSPTAGPYDTMGLAGLGYDNQHAYFARNDCFVLGCLQSATTALIAVGSCLGGSTSIYRVANNGAATLLNSNVSSILGVSAVGGMGTSLSSNYLDLSAYTFEPYGSNFLYVNDANEIVLDANGVVISSSAALGSFYKANISAPLKFDCRPIMIDTNFGRILTTQSIPPASGMKWVPINTSTHAFGTPVTLSGVGDCLLRSVASVANPQGFAPACYQITTWDRSGTASNYGWAESIQGMTFIGVAKTAAAANAQVSVQVLGTAKLRSSFSKPMLVDTRVTVSAQTPIIQSNTMGTLATIVGDTAFLKGLS